MQRKYSYDYYLQTIFMDHYFSYFFIFDETHHHYVFVFLVLYFEWRVINSRSESLGNYILAIYRPISLHSILSKLLKTTVAIASA